MMIMRIPQTLPTEILVQYWPQEAELLSQWLSSTKAKKVTLLHPQKGDKKQVLDLAIENAAESQKRAVAQSAHQLKRDPTTALLFLQEKLLLRNVPRRIECYDISHIQGTHTVASMVVFTDGVPDKKEYRSFNIQFRGRRQAR